MSGDINTPIPDDTAPVLRHLLRMLADVISAESGWRGGLSKTGKDNNSWLVWSHFAGAVKLYNDGDTRSTPENLADARLLPEFVLSWVSTLSTSDVSEIGTIVTSRFAGDGASEKVGALWVSEVSRVSLDLHYRLSSDWFD